MHNVDSSVNAEFGMLLLQKDVGDVSTNENDLGY